MKISVEGPASRVLHSPMSLPRKVQVHWLTCGLLMAALAQATTPLFQSSFHKFNQDWSVVQVSATPDCSVLHENNPSLRVERDSSSDDACIRLAPVAFTLGKRYEVSGWVRMEALEVRDLGRSPIASGATLTMASMPFDVHSASVGGTEPWTHLTLRFVASRTRDQILLPSATVARSVAGRGSRAFSSGKFPPAKTGQLGKASRPLVPPTATQPPAGSISTLKAKLHMDHGGPRVSLNDASGLETVVLMHGVGHEAAPRVPLVYQPFVPF